VAAGTDAGRPRPTLQRDRLVASLTDPFNLVVLAVLLAIGAVLGTLAVTAGLALLVYVVAVALRYRRPES
jgi:hypothetical protein